MHIWGKYRNIKQDIKADHIFSTKNKFAFRGQLLIFLLSNHLLMSINYIFTSLRLFERRSMHRCIVDKNDCLKYSFDWPSNFMFCERCVYIFVVGRVCVYTYVNDWKLKILNGRKIVPFRIFRNFRVLRIDCIHHFRTSRNRKLVIICIAITWEKRRWNFWLYIALVLEISW